MVETSITLTATEDVTLLKLAREIAMEIFPLDAILKNNQIDLEKWQNIQDTPRFQNYLDSELQAWSSALNTHDRVKLKSAALVEEWLPELYARLHDRGESLSAKIEGGKLARDLAGMGGKITHGDGSGERFTVTINLGADNQLKFENTATVIDATATEL
jgi:hypothetical protein